jgi:hypothetical protein
MGARSVTPITSTPLATGETRQASRRAAAEALTKKQDTPHEVVVSKRPAKKATQVTKTQGGKK